MLACRCCDAKFELYSEVANGVGSAGRAWCDPVECNSRFLRTADLGALDYTAQCHEGPVWASRAAATVILANDGCGPNPDECTRSQGLARSASFGSQPTSEAVHNLVDRLTSPSWEQPNHDIHTLRRDHIAAYAKQSARFPES